MSAIYSVPHGDRIYAGRPLPVHNPDEISFTWPPGPNCVIPSAEGVNAPIHPKVVDMQGRTPSGRWPDANGYRYWMAWTPYPISGSADTKEQPCIVASNDGLNWVAPAPNPIVPAPPLVAQGKRYNSDTHLVLHNNALYLIWRLFDDLDAEKPWREVLKYKVTLDGVNWSEERPMNLESISLSDKSMLLSPAVEFHNGTWYCWSLRRNVTSTPIPIELRTAPQIFGPWSAPTNCNIVLPDATREPWHLDVTRIPNGWAMLITDRDRATEASGRLWLAYGDDAGLAWTPKSNYFAAGSPNTYRSCLVRDATGFRCWITDYDARKIRPMNIICSV